MCECVCDRLTNDSGAGNKYSRACFLTYSMTKLLNCQKKNKKKLQNFK